VGLLTKAELRDRLIIAWEMSSPHQIQTPEERCKRIYEFLERVCTKDDDIMRGFMGYGGPHVVRDAISGGGGLDDPLQSSMKLIAVGTDDPNPENWRAWDDVVLYLAPSVEEALKLEYPHGHAENFPAVEVDASKASFVMRMEPYTKD